MKPDFKEKVSIVIPVYNRKEILGKTLAGILHQTYPLDLIEVIIADDGSSDNPDELVKNSAHTLRLSMSGKRTKDSGQQQ